ncbi:hypothetical protein H1C71_042695, partial [Ictidomys tridecemlineatus]
MSSPRALGSSRRQNPFSGPEAPVWAGVVLPRPGGRIEPFPSLSPGFRRLLTSWRPGLEECHFSSASVLMWPAFLGLCVLSSCEDASHWAKGHEILYGLSLMTSTKTLFSNKATSW